MTSFTQSGEPTTGARWAGYLLTGYLGAAIMAMFAWADPLFSHILFLFQSGKARAIDGRFAESKELIAGYLVLDLPSLDAVAAWAPTCAKAIGDAEFDIRPLYEPAGFR